MNYIEAGYSKLLKYKGGLDLSAVDSGLNTDFSGGSATIGSGSSNVLTNPITDSRNPEAVKEGVVPSQWEIGRHAFIHAGVDGYNDGTGFFLGWSDTLATYVLSMGNSSADNLTWNGSVLNITGDIIADGGAIGGWNITATTLYALASGTPSAAPTDGIVLTSGATSSIIIYEDGDARLRLGNLAAGVFGILGYATNGSTILFELSDTQNLIAGWTISETTLANGTNVILDATNAALSLNSATFATDGIQLQYNAGNPRAYIGDGASQFFSFNGTNISWDGANSSLSTAGHLTTTSATIGGWSVVSGYIYNLQSGTPTAVPNDGVVLASGNEALLVYEDTALRAELGFLSAGVYGLKIYATDGSTVIFEASDTQQIVAGWTFTNTSLYNLASGTPTAAPNDGLVLTANATPAVIAYEDTAKRAEMGYLSAGVFGFKAYATNGTTVIFEMSDTRQLIAGWNFTDTLLRSGSTDANSNVLIDSANSLLRLGPTTGDYVTLDGANQYLRSSNYVSGALGAGFTLEPDLLEVGNASIRGRLQMATFVANSISANNGDILVAIGADVLDVDMTALDASTVTITGDMTLAVNDIIRIKEGLDDEWMLVTNIASAPTYTVTRDQAAAYAANTNPAWTKGATVVNFGQSGDGGVFLTASDTNSPFVSIYTHAGSPWSALTTRLRLGNLNGYLGYAADIYGLGVGSVSAGEANITIEPTNGLRIRSGTTLLFQVDNAGTATIGSFTLAATTISATNLTITSGVANTANITVGTGATAGGLNSANAAGDITFWSGSTFANRATAPFRVEADGSLTATDATITGSITVTAGSTLNTFPTDASLVLFLPMDEGTGSLTRDATTNAYNGTIAAGVSYGSGVSGTCLTFTAATNSTVSISSSAVNGLDDFSVSFWCTLTELTSAFRCALSCATAARTNEFYIGYEPALNRWNLAFVNVEYTWSDSTIEDGAFHHICVTRSGTTATLYLDGTSLGTNTVSTNALVVDSGGFILGQDQDSVGGGYDATQAWVGNIDELRIYNVVLTALQVYSLYQLPSANSSQGVKALGGTYASASSGARILMFPDSSTAIQIIDDAGADVFKTIVGGADVGDVIMGSESGGTYAKWDKSASTFSVTGPILTGLAAGSSVNGQYLSDASVASAAVNLALRGWTQTSAFSVTDADTVAWGAGTFTASDGTAYSIGAGNTGNMVAKTYIYLDIAVSLIAYQTTTTAATAVGNGKVLVAIAQNGTGEASFMLLNNNSYNIDGANLVVGTVTTNEIAATTIVGSNINTLSITGKTVLFDTGTVGGWTLAAGTLSSGSVIINATTQRILMGAATAPLTGTGVFLGLDGADYEFRVGNPAGEYVHWDGTNLTITGDVINATTIQIGASTITSTATELNYLDITTLGTGAASKAVVLDGGEDYIWPATGQLTYGGTAITATGAELNKLDGASANVTPTNLNTLTASSTSDASSLHYHPNKVSSSVSDVTVTNTVTETNLVSFSVPANTLGTANVLKVEVMISDIDIGADVDGQLTIRLKYGATTIATALIQNLDTGAATSAFTNGSGKIEAFLFANGATNVQEGSVDINVGSFRTFPTATNLPLGESYRDVAVGTAAEDSTGALTLTITAQWNDASTNNSITVVHYVASKIL